MKPIKTIAISILLLLLFSCFSNHLEGTYIGNENAFFDQLTFKPGSKVEIVFMGTTSEADYYLEDNKVKITNAGETQIFTITKDGCVDGGGFIGIYCK